MVPGYTDISHFRAPYKNSYIYTGVGADESGPPMALSQSTELKGGLVHWKPDVADTIITGLKAYNAIFLSERAVQLVPFTAEQAASAELVETQSAAAWLQRELKRGNIVFATPGVVFPVAGLSRQLAAVPKSDKETIKMTSAIAPILATPSMLAGLMTPLALAGVALVGGVALWAIVAGLRSRKTAAPA